MSRSTALAADGGRRADRLARAAQRLLRIAADARLALALLLLAGAWNAAAAALPFGGWLLSSPPYLALLRLLLRGERFDRPDGELERLVAKMAAAVGPARG